jgi:methylenetetrahydrofolate dehydrogenase (NADP+)/methenyltetrahydrofolate cyclohydrolase
MPPAKIIDGKRIAAQIRADLAIQVREVTQQQGQAPKLVAVLVGDDPASAVYVRNKRRAAGEVGLISDLIRLPRETQEDQLLELISTLNTDRGTHGILVQLPLPPAICASRILDALDPHKDVDGFHSENVGRLVQGRPRFLPCTPLGVQALLAHSNLPTRGRRVAIVGRSDIVGKPLAMMLVQRTSRYGPDFANATVTLCHSQTRDLGDLLRQAEIVIAAAGVPGLITGEMLNSGAVVIDVGINRTAEGLVGDVDFASASQQASWITPVPGGVGPMTIAMLLTNTLQAARSQ